MKTTTIKALAIGLAVSFVSLPAHAQDTPIKATDCITDDFAIAAHGSAIKAVKQNGNVMDMSSTWNRETRRHFNAIINAKLAVCGLPFIEFEEAESVEDAQ